MNPGLQRVRDSGFDAPTGRQLDEEEPAGVRGDREISQWDHALVRLPMLTQGDHVRQKLSSAGDVLVAPSARRERELRRDRLRLGRAVGAGEPGLVLGRKQGGEPPGHAAAGPRGPGHRQPK